ncbi:MAG: anthrone oxygenase family protein [Myxococcota bacterium]
MTLTWMQAGIIIGAVAAAMASGMSYVFSTGVMQALGQLPQAEAVRAMQAINVAVINPLFLGVFMGTGLFVAGLAGADVWHHAEAANPWLLGGTAVYLIGMVLVTIGGNVPLNDQLATLDPNALSADAWWAYARPWLAWNHLRTLAAAGASTLFVLAALR